MPLLRQLASTYVLHRLSPPPPAGPSGYADARRVSEDPAPLRWLRDLGFDAAGDRHQSGVRASDADRERVVTFLKGHSAEGRLTTEELTSRVEAAYTGVSLAQLDRLTADLPGSPFATEAPPAPRRSFVGPMAHLGAIVVGLLVLVALSSLLAPPEVWASLLVLFVPLGAFALISILPFALPVLALLLLAGLGGRSRALDRGHPGPSLPSAGRRGGVRVWRL